MAGEEGLPIKKTYALVVNRPIPLHNRCREGMVSPMTRSTVLKPEEVGAYAVLEEEPQLDWGLPEILGTSRAKEKAATRAERKC